MTNGVSPKNTNLYRSEQHSSRSSSLVKHAGCRIAILLAVLALTLAADPCNSAPEPQRTVMPDVLVWIDARNPGMQWVSITYPTVVQRSQAQAHLSLLLKETGWNASDIKISDASVMTSGANPMTSAEFITTNAIKLETKYLPVEPIIKSLTDLKRVEIFYLMPAGFQFRGLQDYENRYVRITLGRSENTYHYIIDVKRSDFDKLNLPVPGSEAQSSANSRNYHPAVLALLIALALATAILVYALTAGLINKRQKPPAKGVK